MRQVVGDVREVGMLRLQALHQLHRVSYGRVRRMWMMPQRVEEQDVEILQLRQRLFRHAAEVGEVRRRTKAISLDGNVAVMHNQRSKRCSEQFQRAVHRLYLDLRESTVLVVPLEDVTEDATQHLRGRVAGEQGDLAATGDAGKAERPNVVEPENVVGVAMSVEHG